MSEVHLPIIIWIFPRMYFICADLGFKQISVEPVVAAQDEDYAIRPEDVPQIMEEYDLLAREYDKKGKRRKRI